MPILKSSTYFSIAPRSQWKVSMWFWELFFFANLLYIYLAWLDVSIYIYLISGGLLGMMKMTVVVECTTTVIFIIPSRPNIQWVPWSVPPIPQSTQGNTLYSFNEYNTLYSTILWLDKVERRGRYHNLQLNQSEYSLYSFKVFFEW